jgi:hypothetical protein
MGDALHAGGSGVLVDGSVSGGLPRGLGGGVARGVVLGGLRGCIRRCACFLRFPSGTLTGNAAGSAIAPVLKKRGDREHGKQRDAALLGAEQPAQRLEQK